MRTNFTANAATNRRARTLEKRWQKLCASCLPIAGAGSIWNYHKVSDQGPECGWKLHVSATILNAGKVLQAIAPILCRSGVQFKAPRSLHDLAKLNSGLHQAYTQVGKVITVYPRSDKEAVRLASRLHQATRRFKAPAVPFDLRFCEGSNVYYRYGAFSRNEIAQADSPPVLAVKSASGQLVPDDRKIPKPDWINDPFAVQRRNGTRPKQTSAKLPAFQVLRAVVQRGKGGVYQAVDLHSNPARLCLLKEGRRYGEVSWDGRDGAWRARHEERVLALLRQHGVRVPHIYSSFEMDGNYYLMMEFVDGESLHDLLLHRRQRLSMITIVSMGNQLAAFLAQMHQAGWAWRDCKPKNLIITVEGMLVPIDFEGACEINNPDFARWGTPGFVPSKSPQDLEHAVVGDDLFGLGATLYLLITGRIFDPKEPVAIRKLRRNVPLKVLELVESLLDENPEQRPSIQAVHARLSSILRKDLKPALRLPKSKAA